MQSHYNDLFFCLDLFNSFAKQATQYYATSKMVLHTDTMLQNSAKYRFVHTFFKK